MDNAIKKRLLRGVEANLYGQLVVAVIQLAGVPCVGSSSGAIPDVIGPGGMIFQEGDVDELADKLAQLIAVPDT